jgi:CheY-like chemotaxis protein
MGAKNLAAIASSDFVNETSGGIVNASVGAPSLAPITTEREIPDKSGGHGEPVPRAVAPVGHSTRNLEMRIPSLWYFGKVQSTLSSKRDEPARLKAHDWYRSGGLPMPRLWQVIHSVFGGATSDRMDLPAQVPVIALIAHELDRQLLKSVAGPQSLEVHFVESCEQARALAENLAAPLILLDRDWPGIEWRVWVERLAASSHDPCVILVSGVADAYLWQELIRRGGYDILAKPLREGNVTRIIRLALSWASAPKPIAQTRKSQGVTRVVN